MVKFGSRMFGLAFLVLTFLGSGIAYAESQLPSKSRVVAALQNILALERPGKTGYATIYDGNKYIQCGRSMNHSLRCEAAGTLMQPSLAHVLVPERLKRLLALGWHLDPHFGNYVQVFPAEVPPEGVADKILQTLSQAYSVDLDNLQEKTKWIESGLCPPRNGPTQNLAGMIDDAPEMASVAVHECAYTGPDLGDKFESTEDLIAHYGKRVAAEIQRLRINPDQDIFFVLSTEIGFVQCAPQSVSEIFCEAQSIDSWPALAAVLTSDRIARLHAAGYEDPGRSQNYRKVYSLDKLDDMAIARELLAVLHDAYGYLGLPALKIETETGHS
ncbi:MAG TPA: hypothetical protein VKV77_09445 [Methylovirgula sp.]|nr:hypothetical protein [Methylovirgula sp.]